VSEILRTGIVYDDYNRMYGYTDRVISGVSPGLVTETIMNNIGYNENDMQYTFEKTVHISGTLDNSYKNITIGQSGEIKSGMDIDQWDKTYRIDTNYNAVGQVSGYTEVNGKWNNISNQFAGDLKETVRINIIYSKSGLISAVSLGFAHTLGEFGVVLMIGGNIENETRVVSIAIYDHVETLQFNDAHQLSLILIGFSLALLTLLYRSKNNRVGFS